MPNKEGILASGDYKHKEYVCEYLVIGTGAGGSVAGALLAEKGHNVIFLEEGGYFPTTCFNENVGELTAKLYRNGGIFPFLGFPIIASVEGCCVGGGTVVNGAGLFRTPKWILEEWERKGLKGYNYADLEKHFKTIEKDLHIASKPIKKGTNLDTLKLIEGAGKLGWRTELVPRAAKGCAYLNSCSVGCPIGAKQSTLVTYLPRALKAGARIFSNCRAVKIKHSNGLAHTVIAKVMKKKIKITFKHLIVAGGAIQTPHLLRKNNISKLAGKSLQFHMNVKVIARLKDAVYGDSTMFPVQIHEFEHENAYINTSVVKPSYLAMSLSPYGNEVIDHALENFRNMVIFNTTMKVKSKARIVSCFENPLVWYHFDQADTPKLKSNIKRMSLVLFNAGAQEVFLPVKGAPAAKSIEEVDDIIKKTKPGEIEINTVHIMASCPMGTDPKTSVVNTKGIVWGMKNVLIADSSILPSSIGQSPQGTIMAFVHEVMRRHFETNKKNE